MDFHGFPLWMQLALFSTIHRTNSYDGIVISIIPLDGHLLVPALPHEGVTWGHISLHIGLHLGILGIHGFFDIFWIFGVFSGFLVKY